MLTIAIFLAVVQGLATAEAANNFNIMDMVQMMLNSSASSSTAVTTRGAAPTDTGGANSDVNSLE